MGIANLLFIPMLENAGYIVSTHKKKEWVVITPKGKTITFKRDSGVCQGMPYIGLQYNKDGICMIETVRKNFARFAKRKIKKAQLSRTVQKRIGNPPNGRFKDIFSLGQNGLQISQLKQQTSTTQVSF